MYSGWQEKGCVRDINYMITEKFLFATCHRKDRSTRVRYKKLTEFETRIKTMKRELIWDKKLLVELFNDIIPNFGHKETGKYLDSKM